MRRVRLAALAGVTLLLIVLGARFLARGQRDPARRSPGSAAPGDPAAAPVPPGGPPAELEPATEADRGFLYGRVATTAGGTYQGRLRFGGGEEAFWGDTFNGTKRTNPWVAHVPPDALPVERRTIELFGIELSRRERPAALTRPFMVRFGDVDRIEARGRDVVVTLRSGTVIVLDRLEASDFDDGVRVWDRTRGILDLDSREIHSIDFLPTARLGDVPARLHGTVGTPYGEFTGHLQWDLQHGVGSDELAGRPPGGQHQAVPFDAIRSIARRPGDGVLVTLHDGRELVLTGAREVGDGNRGIVVDDPRYGRVLVPWAAFDRVDLEPAGTGPGRDDFPPGRPLAGSVTARAGRRLAGRLVFDLDESETVETLDAPSRGLGYSIPFALVAAIELAGAGEPPTRVATVTLDGGERLELERSGDLGPGNAGLLVFGAGGAPPDYVPWSEVARIDLDPDAARGIAPPP